MEDLVKVLNLSTQGESKMISFEGMERRIDKINSVLKEYGIKSLEECKNICLKNNINVEEVVRSVQPICFDNAVWAYTMGVAIALTLKPESAEECAKAIGIGLEAFTVNGSVADNRKIGIGHGNLAGLLLNENTKCFCFLAGHESFAAAEGAISIAESANTARTTPLKVILVGLGKDAAYLIARINGFTYVKTEYDFEKAEVKVLEEKVFSQKRANIKIYGCNDVNEGVKIMELEDVDVSITGNSTNPTRFQHPVAGIYKNRCLEKGKKYFSVASGGGTGRTLHPDNLGAGPASYGLTDTMGRMHCDVQFAGSSSVPAHVDMMGFIGMGNNPMVGATVNLAVKTYETIKKAH